MRITQTAKSDSVLLERMKDYTFSDEDRRLFTHRWPKGIAISRRGRLGALERWMQYKNNETRAAPDRKKPCLITEKTIEIWIRTIGRLHEQTTPSLAATKLFDGNRSTLGPDTVTTTLAYFAWCGAATLLQDQSFCEFLYRSLLCNISKNSNDTYPSCSITEYVS